MRLRRGLSDSIATRQLCDDSNIVPSRALKLGSYVQKATLGRLFLGRQINEALCYKNQ